MVYMMVKYGMMLCVLGIVEEMCVDGIVLNMLWLCMMVVIVVVQNLLGGDEVMVWFCKFEVYVDVVYVIVNKFVIEYIGKMLLCEDVFVEFGVIDLLVYDCVLGVMFGVDLWVEDVNLLGYFLVQ